MSARKPIHCPFCGGRHTTTDAWGEGFGTRTDRYIGEVKCRSCGVSLRVEHMPIDPDTTTRVGCAEARKLAVEHWNDIAGKEA